MTLSAQANITVSLCNRAFAIAFRVSLLHHQTWSVPKLIEYTTTLSLNRNDYISGSIVVAGWVSNAINFYITDPNGNNVVSYNDVTQVSFSFAASTTGNYTVYFDNREGLFAKSVTFNYNDRAAVLGLPQYTFILLLSIVIVIVVVVIAVFSILRRRPKETPKTLNPV